MKNISQPDIELGGSKPAICEAHRAIAIAMGTCLAMWPLPVVSGLFISLLEANLIRDLLKILGRDASRKTIEELFWFFRRKLLALYAATYIPWVGTAFQLFEVYALGQFVITYASRIRDLDNEKCMSESWTAIEQEIFCGDLAVASYEQWTGRDFPANIRDKFVSSVDRISDIYRTAERVPGAEVTQDILGRTLRKTVEIAVEASFQGVKAVGWIGRKVAKLTLQS